MVIIDKLIGVLDKSGNLTLERELYEVEAVWEDTATADDSILLDDSILFNDVYGSQDVMRYVLGIDHTWHEFQTFQLSADLHMRANEFIEDENLSELVNFDGGFKIKGQFIEP